MTKTVLLKSSTAQGINDMLNSILVTQNDSLSDFKEDCILVVFFLLFFDALKLILCYGLAYISMYSRPSEST